MGKKKKQNSKAKDDATKPTGEVEEELDLIECSQRQQEEIEVLQAIYPDEFETSELDEEQQVHFAHMFGLTISPVAGITEDQNVQVKLWVKFPVMYPEVPPSLSVERVVGLSDGELKSLLERLREVSRLPENHCRVHILEIAQETQEYLAAPEVNRKRVSLYEEMVRNASHEQEEEEEEDKEEEKERDTEQEIRNLLTNVLKEDEEGPQTPARKNDLTVRDALHELGEESTSGTGWSNDMMPTESESFPSVNQLLQKMSSDERSSEMSHTLSGGVSAGHEILLVHLIRQFANDQQDSLDSDPLNVLLQQATRAGLVVDRRLWTDKSYFDAKFASQFSKFVEQRYEDQFMNLFWQSDQRKSDRVSTAVSRYESDFKEYSILGRGAFGEVVKAKNKLDGRYYAVKKIGLKRLDEARVLREVSTLSQLYHQHVVRYFQAWIEVANNTSGEDKASVVSSATVSRSGNFKESIGGFSLGGGGFSLDLHSDSLYRPSHDESSSQFDGSTTEYSSTALGDSSGGTTIKHITSYLYITMEYCRETLRGIIQKVLPHAATSERFRLLRQILEGLVHIHSAGIIHRDLKPSNIFVADSGDIKIGDFGLATKTEKAHAGQDSAAQTAETIEASGTNDGDSVEDGRTTGVGTLFYIAPEQDVEEQYDEKVDMYSLGIIFFEMVWPITTGHERAIILTNLRKDLTFPENFEHKNPQEAKIIKWMLQEDPANRPTALELLQSNLLPPKQEAEYQKEALRTIANPQSSFYQKLMESLFISNRQNSVSKFEGTDLSVHCEEHELGIPHLLEEARMKLTTLMKYRGGLPLNLAKEVDDYGIHYDLEAQYHPQKGLVLDGRDYMDVDGNMICLSGPETRRTAFARMLATHDGTFLKRYEFSDYYLRRRKDASHAFVAPKAYHKCDFDIVNAEEGAGEAEIVHLISKFAEELPILGGHVDVEFGHTALIPVLFQSLSIPEKLWPEVIAILKQERYGSKQVAAQREKLLKLGKDLKPKRRGGGGGDDGGSSKGPLPPWVVEKLLACRAPRKDFLLEMSAHLASKDKQKDEEAKRCTADLILDLFVSKGQDRLGLTENPVLSSVCRTIEVFLDHLTDYDVVPSLDGAFNLQRPTLTLSLDLCLQSRDWYSGLVFRASTKLTSLAVGGQYSERAQRYGGGWVKQAVGVTFDLERSVEEVVRKGLLQTKKPNKAVIRKASDEVVLHCQNNSPKCRSQRNKLATLLWEQQVKAYPLFLPAAQVIAYARSEGVGWIVKISEKNGEVRYQVDSVTGDNRTAQSNSTIPHQIDSVIRKLEKETAI